MPGFGPASAPVANCGVLGFLEAPSSYKIDYKWLGFSSSRDDCHYESCHTTQAVNLTPSELLGEVCALLLNPISSSLRQFFTVFSRRPQCTRDQPLRRSKFSDPKTAIAEPSRIDVRDPPSHQEIAETLQCGDKPESEPCRYPGSDPRSELEHLRTQSRQSFECVSRVALRQAA